MRNQETYRDITSQLCLTPFHDDPPSNLEIWRTGRIVHTHVTNAGGNYSGGKYEGGTTKVDGPTVAELRERAYSGGKDTTAATSDTEWAHRPVDGRLDVRGPPPSAQAWDQSTRPNRAMGALEPTWDWGALPAWGPRCTPRLRVQL